MLVIRPVPHLINTVLLLALITLLSACQTAKEQRPASPRADIEHSESSKLAAILDDYFQEYLALNPVYATFIGTPGYNHAFTQPISQASLAAELAFEKKYLSKMNTINKQKLRGQDLLSYEIFMRDRALNIDGFTFQSHLMPISQMGGAHTYFAMLGSGSSAHPFNTEKDYRDFIQRSQGFAAYMDSVITAMQEGARKGVVLQKAIVVKLIPQLEAHLVDDVSTSVFYAPINKLEELDDISADDKTALKNAYIETIQTVIIPAYARVHAYIKDAYLPRARTSTGLMDLPNGKAWYEHRIEDNTTLPLTAEEIHRFGEQEVARILTAMNTVKTSVGFDGSLAEFFDYLRDDDQFYFDTEAEVIAAYENVKAKINDRVTRLFEVFPKADYEVRAVEAFRASSAAGASYHSPAPDGSRPGIFYINTHNLKAQPKFLIETLSIHEAAPGHHFQISIQQELENLPAFRKFGGYTVFAEGWALYAESLGKEMGLFSDPYMWYGRLADEQLRAMRLVVDTGIHAFGWTREQAIDFMSANSSMAKSDVVAEVERYIAIPGQALAYKTGERHIRMLRNKAEQTLKEKFDVKKFHTQILIDGALPMPILEAKIDRWISSQG